MKLVVIFGFSRTDALRERQLGPDFQGRQVREEVVSDKETHEHPVVDAPLKVKREGQTGHGQLSSEILKRNAAPLTWNCDRNTHQQTKITAKHTNKAMWVQ